MRPGKMLNTIGKVWTEFQILKYKSNTQPLYVLMDHNEENLIAPVAYTPDVDEFHNWLHTGIANFK